MCNCGAKGGAGFSLLYVYDKSHLAGLTKENAAQREIAAYVWEHDINHSADVASRSRTAAAASTLHALVADAAVSSGYSSSSSHQPSSSHLP
eukprot:653036-Pleurochrysis_carterae.AAC.1